MANPQPVFSPACPIPYVLQPAERIQQLKDYLPTEFGQIQRVNVEALIKLYESGEIGPRQLGDAPIYLVEGKRVDKNPWEDESAPPNAMKWCEEIRQQMLQQSGC
ncbi:60S ribosomal protein L43 [Paecilomyces lecythidis]|uniref:60S ribosomal protein L43 n=1 Tax=Paecilomyces lecythidis TaxID=3004212 RepID=A0ABR3YEZ1_9EURO